MIDPVGLGALGGDAAGSVDRSEQRDAIGVRFVVEQLLGVEATSAGIESREVEIAGAGADQVRQVLENLQRLLQLLIK